MRLCANKCNGDVVVDTASDQSVTCWTNEKGITYCPRSRPGDPDNGDDPAVPDDGKGKEKSKGNDTPSSSSSTPVLLVKESDLVWIVLVCVVVAVVFGCIFLYFAWYRKRNKRSTDTKGEIHSFFLSLVSSTTGKCQCILYFTS